MAAALGDDGRGSATVRMRNQKVAGAAPIIIVGRLQHSQCAIIGGKVPAQPVERPRMHCRYLC